MPTPPARYSTAATATSVANSRLRRLRLCPKSHLTSASQAYRPPPGGMAGSGRSMSSARLASVSVGRCRACRPSVAPDRLLAVGVELVRLILARVAGVGVDGARLVIALPRNLGLALGHDRVPLRSSALAPCLRGPFLGF